MAASASALRRLWTAAGVLAVGCLAAAGPGTPAFAAPPAGTGAALAAARAHREAHGAAILRDFAELLALPNVASDAAGIRANAAAIAAALARRGVRVEVLGLPGAPEAPPVVYGELPAPGATRTLLLYVHYDGQPVDEARWSQPPWRPTLYTRAIEAGGTPRPLPGDGEAIDPEWRLYARSAADDKAPIAALLAALDALAAAGIERTANLKLFFEGEEEAGSPHLGAYLETYADRLGGDAWLFLDGPVHQSGRPQLFFGVRGYAGLEITVYGASRYLHSGHYGNFAPNPALELARLLAGMKDADGRVTVEGFYDTVTPLGAAERRALAAVPPFEDELRHELGLAASEGGDARYDERIALPSLNVRGFVSGTVGATARNVIPPEATASIDLRLVKGNDPAAMLALVEAHVRRQGYHVLREPPDEATRLAHPRIARLVPAPHYRAVRTPIDLPIAGRVAAAAEAAAAQDAAGPVVLTPTLGGSLPLYLFEDLSGLPLVGVPMANHDNNQHAPDENLRIGNLWYGIDLLAALLTMPAEPAGAPGTGG
jgi:acetylornithine deacetylase/succinyl-diaminopimelate desuccinylase-like protein